MTLLSKILQDQLPSFVRWHKLYKTEDGKLMASDEVDFEEAVKEQVLIQTKDLEEAQIISSEIEDIFGENVHRPLIDIDFEAALIPSSTEGHYHLYLDKYLTWDQYKRLLDVLQEVGIIGPGYHHASVYRKATSLRLPWVKK